jgi:hypothetical protein
VLVEQRAEGGGALSPLPYPLLDVVALDAVGLARRCLEGSGLAKCMSGFVTLDNFQPPVVI